MTGITVQSFLSAAAGMAVAVALIRGFARRTTGTIGNFWVDLTRGTLYVLLPICIAAALFFVEEGVPQTLGGYVQAETVDAGRQLIARGPIASQEAIKLLSGDGGGFFNVNSAHPFENPTPLTNLVEMGLILLLGAALTNTFGRMVGSERQGWVVARDDGVAVRARNCRPVRAGNARQPGVRRPRDRPSAGPLQPGGNMEGKEVRFGIAGIGALCRGDSTASSDGAVDAMHDSFLPLSGAILLANMMVDEVIVGAPGSGLWGMLLFALVTVFIAGLDDRPDAGIHRQEDRGARNQDDNAGPARGASSDPRPDRIGERRSCRGWPGGKFRTARLLRDPLRLYLGSGDQWQRLCRV